MAQNERTVLGLGTRVRGRILGGRDLEIGGHVEGEIEASGEVLVAAGGTVAANLQSTRIVVRGAVKGDLVATESIHLEDGARVVGDVRAPRIAIAQGALVRGYVQTGNAGVTKPRTQAAPARVTTPVAVRTAPARPVAPTRPAPPPVKVEAKPEKKPVVSLSGAKVAPKPVVPVLKKGAKGTLAKKKG